MSHERFEIWEETDSAFPQWPWRAQVVNYVARFASRESAESFVKSVKEYREQNKLK
jgi:hypothetical protein